MAVSKRSRRVGLWVAGALVVSTLLLSAALAGSGNGGFGRVVDRQAENATAVLSCCAPSSFGFADANGDGSFDANESVYLEDETGSVSSLDVRIANPANGELGSQVQATDDDFGDGTIALPGQTAFFDGDGDGVWSRMDTLYRDVDDSGDVTAGDLRLSGDQAGTVVASGDANVSDPLGGFQASFSVLESDGDAAYTSQDRVLLDADGDGFGTVGDVRLTVPSFGDVLDPTDAITVHALETSTGTSAPTGVGYVDADGDGTFDVDEALYACEGCGSVQANDVRIANPPTGGLGSQVQAVDADFGDSLTAPNGTATLGSLSFVDADGDSAFSAGDTLVLEAAEDDDQVTVGDVFLSGTEAGQIANASNPRTGTGLVDLDGAEIGIFDEDGDVSYDHGDSLVVDHDADGFATVQDVDLGSQAFGTPGELGDGQTTSALGGDDTPRAPSDVGYVDADGDGTFDIDEALYACHGCDNVEANDVRIANPPTRRLGSQVQALHDDFGDPLTIPNASSTLDAASFYDADGDDTFSLGDVLVLETGLEDDAVSVGDVFLSGDDAGTPANRSHPMLNLGLTHANITTSYLDADGDDSFGLGDVLAAESNDEGFVDLSDVVFAVANASADNGTAQPPVPPSPPRNLTAEPGPGLGEVILEWEKPAHEGRAEILSYRIYRASGDSEFEHVATVEAPNTTYRDEHRTPTVETRYAVSAVNTVGEGNRSHPATAQGAPSTCASLVCVRTVPLEPVAEITTARADIGTRFTFSTTTLEVEAARAGLTQRLVVPHLEDQPPLPEIERAVGPASVSVDHGDRLCVRGLCTFGLAESPDVATGTLWSARVEVGFGGTVVTETHALVPVFDR